MGARILVVEDEESMRELLRLHLEHAGYDVVCTEDGIAAGYEVLKQPFELIICDVDMPNMNGFQFVEALRADASLPRTPVIFLTSVEEGGTRATQLGAADYILKPVVLERLLKAVHKALGQP